MPVSEDKSVMLAALRERFDGPIKVGEPLSRHGTFGVGGPADVWLALTNEAELMALVALAQEHARPLLLVGNGTNVLFSDSGARGIVARMALDEWQLEEVDAEHMRLFAGAGANLPKLVNELARRGLTGLEWGAGVPGTVGGAVVSNAGAHGACVADTIETAHVFFLPEHTGDETAIRELAATELELGYRRSRFRAAREITFDDEGRPSAASRAPIEPREMITGATFLLRRADPAAVKERVAAYKLHRKQTQPTQGSAGSVFKNPDGDYSARLIQEAGLKGYAIGGAQISTLHANFIVNRGGATAAEVVALIALARRTVRERFGVELELEVELRGDW